MNSAELQQILNQPKNIDASTAIELNQLCKEFPFFAWPYAALTAHQLDKNDFRLENTLHQTSLRIHNRQWLQDYLFVTANRLEKPKDEEPINSSSEESSENQEHDSTSDAFEAINPSLKPLEEDYIELEITFVQGPLDQLPIEESEPSAIKPKIIAPVYNLEDLFPAPEPEPDDVKRVASTNFYDWLNAGGLQKSSPANKPLERKEDLIEKFLKTKPSISRPKQEFYTPEKAMKKSEVLSNKIVTETLANIYTKQGNFEKAIEAYEQLSLKFPEKKPYFANLIDQIKKENNIS